MDYNLLTYNFKKHFNVGDYIQSIAARQFLPRVDNFVNREKLHSYDGPMAKIIMNGWFMHHAENWPPSEQIDPLFVSFHMNTAHAEEMLSAEGIAYFRKHGPIGCRDNTTLKLLKENGIDSYLSSCLTLTLGNTYKNNDASDDVYLVDVLFKHPTASSVFKSFNSFRKSVKNGQIFQLGKRKKILNNVFGDEMIKTTKSVEHDYSSEQYPTEESRFELADSILKRYEKAKLVITSRIHCALPCLAMGTDVIFLNGGLDKASEKCRLDGISSFFNTIDISKDGGIVANFDLNKFLESGTLPPRTDHLKYLENLNCRCESFVQDTGNSA
jgi:hypothetical protein